MQVFPTIVTKPTLQLFHLALSPGWRVQGTRHPPVWLSSQPNHSFTPFHLYSCSLRWVPVSLLLSTSRKCLLDMVSKAVAKSLNEYHVCFFLLLHLLTLSLSEQPGYSVTPLCCSCIWQTSSLPVMHISQLPFIIHRNSQCCPCATLWKISTLQDCIIQVGQIDTLWVPLTEIILSDTVSSQGTGLLCRFQCFIELNKLANLGSRKCLFLLHFGGLIDQTP